MKLLQIYNGLAHYREGIYSLIDREYDSDYLIVRGKSDIKQIDPTIFKGKVEMVEGKSWHAVSARFNESNAAAVNSMI